MYDIKITPNQYVLRVYNSEKGESSKDVTRYTASMLLTDLGQGDCMITLAQGDLNTEINLEIFKALKVEGYSEVQFDVPSGTNATRLARKIKSGKHLDRYVVDLT